MKISFTLQQKPQIINQTQHVQKIFHSLQLQLKQCMVFHQTAGEVSEKQLILTKSGLSNYRFCCITWFSWSSFVNSSDPEFILCSFLQTIYGCHSNITYFFSFFPILSKLFLYTNRNFNLLLYAGIKKYTNQYIQKYLSAQLINFFYVFPEDEL